MEVVGEETYSCRYDDEVGQRYLRAVFFSRYTFEKWHEGAAPQTLEGDSVLQMYDPSP